MSILNRSAVEEYGGETAWQKILAIVRAELQHGEAMRTIRRKFTLPAAEVSLSLPGRTLRDVMLRLGENPPTRTDVVVHSEGSIITSNVSWKFWLEKKRNWNMRLQTAGGAFFTMPCIWQRGHIDIHSEFDPVSSFTHSSGTNRKVNRLLDIVDFDDNPCELTLKVIPGANHAMEKYIEALER